MLNSALKSLSKQPGIYASIKDFNSHIEKLILRAIAKPTGLSKSRPIECVSANNTLVYAPAHRVDFEEWNWHNGRARTEIKGWRNVSIKPKLTTLMIDRQIKLQISQLGADIYGVEFITRVLIWFVCVKVRELETFWMMLIRCHLRSTVQSDVQITSNGVKQHSTRRWCCSLFSKCDKDIWLLLWPDGKISPSYKHNLGFISIISFNNQ